MIKPPCKLRAYLSTIALAALLASPATSAYEIGEDLASDGFWKRDPVLFVRQHADEGLRFTTDARESADSRRDGAVTCFGLPVYETRVAFADGSVSHVELVLFNTSGTEALSTFTDGDGRRFRRIERREQTISREEFFAALKTVRARLTPSGKPPEVSADGIRRDASSVQKAQTWTASALNAPATLTWSYAQKGKDATTFEPGFIRLAFDNPALGTAAADGKKKTAVGKKSIVENVVRDPRGDVFIDNVPMVDQGQKGYCAVAAAERVLRYYGLAIDEHELALAAGTDAEQGTGIRAMKDAVEMIGRKVRLGTIVCYGDFEKSVEERIAGLGDEVRAYNKAAKKLKKPAITEDVYVRREGNTTFYSHTAVDAAMDVEVRKEMRVNGSQKSKFTKFKKDVRAQVAKGIPLFWSVQLGIYPEPEIPQASGGHLRLIIGYNDKKKEILYTDTWGAGHELKRMPEDWAWTITRCLMYMKPLK
jgi:hypothetical protein